VTPTVTEARVPFTSAGATRGQSVDLTSCAVTRSASRVLHDYPIRSVGPLNGTDDTITAHNRPRSKSRLAMSRAWGPRRCRGGNPTPTARMTTADGQGSQVRAAACTGAPTCPVTVAAKMYMAAPTMMPDPCNGNHSELIRLDRCWMGEVSGRHPVFLPIQHRFWPARSNKGPLR
jgi:hypothetical protein